MKRPLRCLEAVYSLDKGELRVTFPEKISEADLADLDAWFALVLRSIKRIARKLPPLEEQ